MPVGTGCNLTLAPNKPAPRGEAEKDAAADLSDGVARACVGPTLMRFSTVVLAVLALAASQCVSSQFDSGVVRADILAHWVQLGGMAPDKYFLKIATRTPQFNNKTLYSSFPIEVTQREYEAYKDRAEACYDGRHLIECPE